MGVEGLLDGFGLSDWNRVVWRTQRQILTDRDAMGDDYEIFRTPKYLSKVRGLAMKPLPDLV